MIGPAGALFFLKAIKIQAIENQAKATKILSLYEFKKNQTVDLTHSRFGFYFFKTNF